MTSLFRLDFPQHRLGTVARLQIEHFALARQLLEVIKIQRPVHCVQAEHAQVALAAVQDFDLEEAERNVEVSHRTQWAESSVAQEIQHAGRKVLSRFFAGNVGPEAADARHSEVPYFVEAGRPRPAGRARRPPSIPNHRK